MGESKQVKVDNWGIFFLQRLQHFFNKTYFCDLTLQFDNNVQLKVHRLVLNACTEYFQALEQTCELINDCLIMPAELQSDVVVPIVNFMYTGILEFQESIFTRLYSAAQLMNMTVLTKLLDAQKVPIAPMSMPRPAGRRVSSHVTWNLQGKKIAPKTMDPDLPEPLPGRKLPVWRRRAAPSAALYRNAEVSSIPDPLAVKYFKREVDDTPKPTRFEWPDEEDTSFDTSSFDEISYTSRPMTVPPRDKSPRPSTSNFEELKRSAGGMKRPAPTTPQQSKRVNIQDVKEYLREQKLRSDYIDYDEAEAADNDLQTYNDDDSADETPERNGALDPLSEDAPSKSILKSDSSGSHNKRVRFSLEEKENADAKPAEPPARPDQPPADMSNHTKIITEVLKKYPHLVKKNKNIRLKILAKGAVSGSPVAAKSPSASPAPAKPTSKVSYMVMKPEQGKSAPTDKKEGHWTCRRCTDPNPPQFDAYYLYRKHLTDAHQEKFDSQMCNICGHTSRKQNMLVYHKYVKHGVDPPAMYQFPKCAECSYVALSHTLLIKHQYNHAHGGLACTQCGVAFPTKSAFISHVQLTGHSTKADAVATAAAADCTYCPSKFASDDALFAHLRISHREDAHKDGLISSDEVEPDKKPDIVEEVAPRPLEKAKDKIKILSNVKITKPASELLRTSSSISSIEKQPDIEKEVKTEEVQSQEPSSEAESLSNVASGIAASLGLVNTIVVLDENQFILQSQDNEPETSSSGNQQEYIIPDMSTLDSMPNLQVSQHQVITSESNAIISQAALSKANIASTDELVMVLTDHDYSDAPNSAVLAPNSSNIVVLYSHPVQGQDTTQYMSQPTNLMLNADMGLMDVDEQYAVTNGAPMPQKQCEESIEMIQQEINNQLETDMPPPPHIDPEHVQHALVQEVITFNNKIEIVNESQFATPDNESDPVEHIEEKTDVKEIASSEIQVVTEKQLDGEAAAADTPCVLNETESAATQFAEPMETEESIELIQPEINCSEVIDTIPNANSVESSTPFTSSALEETQACSSDVLNNDTAMEVDSSRICEVTDANEAQLSTENTDEASEKCNQNEYALSQTTEIKSNVQEMQPEHVPDITTAPSSETELNECKEVAVAEAEQTYSDVQSSDTYIVDTVQQNNELENDATQKSIIQTDSKDNLVSNEINLDENASVDKSELSSQESSDVCEEAKCDKPREESVTALDDVKQVDSSEETGIADVVRAANEVSVLTETIEPERMADVKESKCETVKTITNPKISNLLDDWDDGDTDSQQSDMLKTIVTNRSSINTLIDDWDDEEDT